MDVKGYAGFSLTSVEDNKKRGLCAPMERGRKSYCLTWSHEVTRITQSEVDLHLHLYLQPMTTFFSMGDHDQNTYLTLIAN